MDPKSLHNHITTTPRHKNKYRTSTKPCPGCDAMGELFHYRENCPNRNKICYHCGRLGRIREVCRAIRKPHIEEDDRQKYNPWPSDMIIWSKALQFPTLEFKGMSQYPYLPILSLNEPGTPVEQHRRWINDEPCRETEVESEKVDKPL